MKLVHILEFQLERRINKKKVLFVASVTIHITTFHLPYLKMFKEAGDEVHVASNGEGQIEYADKHFNINFSRSPFTKDNLKAYKDLKKIIEEEKYDIIQCNTPAASALTRLAARKFRKNGTRVIYIAHGFHFFKGAPLKNWILFYPIEKFLSKYTDDLITINEEDYKIAKNNFNAKNTYKINGIGLDASKFENINVDREKVRNDLGLTNEDFAMFFAGELNENKNQIILIEAMKDIAKKNKKFKFFLAGKGPLKEFYENKIKEYKLEKNVFLLGYRNDIPEILKAIDLYISVSKREGLAINIIEAKAAGVPVIASNNRGHRESIRDSVDGFLIGCNDVETLKSRIIELYNNKDLREKFAEESKEYIKKFYLENVYEDVKKIYIK